MQKNVLLGLESLGSGDWQFQNLNSYPVLLLLSVPLVSSYENFIFLLERKKIIFFPYFARDCFMKQTNKSCFLNYFPEVLYLRWFNYTCILYRFFFLNFKITLSKCFAVLRNFSYMKWEMMPGAFTSWKLYLILLVLSNL